MWYFPITVLCHGFLTIGFPALAKDPKTQKPDTQSMMETYKTLATPGKQHKTLAEQKRVLLAGRRSDADAA